MKKYRWMNDLVVLPLHAYEESTLFSPENLQEVSPVLHRNGRYYQRRNNIAWEVINGKGYLLDPQDIKYDLKIMDAENNQLTTQENCLTYTKAL